MALLIRYEDERGKVRTVRAARIITTIDLGNVPVREGSYCVEGIRKGYANAYKPWSAEDDKILTVLFKNGMAIEDIANLFQRKPSAVQSRLFNLGLVENYWCG
jgi:hypothetical protein